MNPTNMTSTNDNKDDKDDKDDNDDNDDNDDHDDNDDNDDKTQIIDGDGCCTIIQTGNGCIRMILRRCSGNESNIIISNGNVTSIVIYGRGNVRNIKFRVIICTLCARIMINIHINLYIHIHKIGINA